MPTFRSVMGRLLRRTRLLINKREYDHAAMCHAIAEEFNLWENTPDGGAMFPVWLSRVVEGEIRDARENAEPSPNKRDRVEQDHNIGVLNRTRQAEDATGDEHEPQ